MHIASQIGGQQQNMRQSQIMSLVLHPQILGTFYDEIWPAGWQAWNRYLNILNVYYYNKTQLFVNSLFLIFLDNFSRIAYWEQMERC